jgi:hypothetical protein
MEDNSRRTLAAGFPNREHSITGLIPENLPCSARPRNFDAVDVRGCTQAEV